MWARGGVARGVPDDLLDEEKGDETAQDRERARRTSDGVVVPTVVVVVTVAVAVVLVAVVVVVAAVVVGGTLVTESLGKDVQEHVAEHPAGGEAQQQRLRRPAMRGVHVWKQRQHCQWRNRNEGDGAKGHDHRRETSDNRWETVRLAERRANGLRKICLGANGMDHDLVRRQTSFVRSAVGAPVHSSVLRSGVLKKTKHFHTGST